MKFMMIVKSAEQKGPPPKELMDAIAKLAAEADTAGSMLGSGGLVLPRWERECGLMAASSV